MAMTQLQSGFDVTLGGTELTYVAANADGNSVVNRGRMLLYLMNAGATDLRVTINSVQACSLNADHDIVVTVPAKTGDLPGQLIVGPINRTRFNNSFGEVEITYPDGVTSLTLASLNI